ncbi:Zinc finger, RING/FYVE/PHD-type [Plasmopara halstedii]|uniref:Zinc finger, RING/FYVE/PHD-type n=1 Tax=Plasmopara halstedii TaxID=4781 RepID=A0A0P1B3Q2_PLAHL|nr:Zinc finger, RING/FYVE/PHD-type [Plasmopara halstedii]CEG48177.1 Zinc finger, RING/FYVE/PHD-type [Plasmopara halstedii]|eukprot:XP_024584546.1 Zinc finger, RING/FYVE/PHD-type [Plasmopara halstedii]
MTLSHVASEAPASSPLNVPCLQTLNPPPDQRKKHAHLQQTSVDPITTDTLVNVPKSRTSHRAAAVAATAVIAAQALEEDPPPNVCISKPMRRQPVNENVKIQGNRTMEMLLYAASEESYTKKRGIEGTTPVSKRTKVIIRNRVSQKRPRTSRRGKKRRQTIVEETAAIEASPLITDLPPLPFTTTKSINQDKKKLKGKRAVAMKHQDEESTRQCEFCKSSANICVLMHCLACRRVYHAGCFVQAFKPYVDNSTPLLDQITSLQLQAPDHRGQLFRCASCKAAFLDFYESGGYMWDCDCPTCLQPEKTRLFRQRKLVQMMNDLELEKRRKKEKKEHQKNAAARTDDKPALVLTSSTSNSKARNRRTHDNCTTTDTLKVIDGAVKVESKDVVIKASTRKRHGVKVGTDVLENGDGLGESANMALSQQQKTEKLQSESEVLQSKAMDGLTIPENELVSSVRLHYDEKTASWSFPIMCSRMASLQAAGFIKTGKCIWYVKQPASIQCNCCDRRFEFSEFVHHTDTSLAQDTNKDEEAFLFVEHRDDAKHTPLKQFLRALKKYVGMKDAMNIKESSGQQAITVLLDAKLEAETAVTRLQALALFKCLKHKALSAVAAFEFAARVVCLSPKYVMSMANGSLVDLVVRSKTSEPGDSFPRKAGWLSFSRQAIKAQTILCECCDRSFSLNDLVTHAGIVLTEWKKKPRHFLYVVERQDESTLMPFTTFVQTLDTAHANNVLDSLLRKVPPLSL